MPGEQLTIADQSITSRKVDLTVSQVDVAASGETTTSTSFTDLATAGPAITLISGVTQDHLLIVSARETNSGNGGYSLISISIAGAAATDDDAAFAQRQSASADSTHERVKLATAQVSPSTHTSKYRVAANIGSYSGRRLYGMAV